MPPGNTYSLVYYLSVGPEFTEMKVRGCTTFSIIAPSLPTFSLKTLSIMSLGMMTLSITSFGIMAISITTISIMTLEIIIEPSLNIRLGF